MQSALKNKVIAYFLKKQISGTCSLRNQKNSRTGLRILNLRKHDFQHWE